ncbi:hypothetical protein H1W37_13320 [Stappia taiwanensis]|uniref:Right handed beta helix domain-containing protein n=1 Tax=Stappia taiwanensis TaxID=992267 RepID=A0A838XUC8_9HYPH|nr:right-handed parallel beta-helix repeat-containing protein [Stappia taiwanensis]MBA4612641.1 hypothetical protein [Stappia taiwanensis]GGE88819.1 hypothetical protein GCM10007285_15400 [Stappia taiwanensis]
MFCLPNSWESVISYPVPHSRFLKGAGRELLSSSCAAALLAGASASANAQDAAPVWGPWGELGAQAGSEAAGFLEGFVPLAQDGESLVFLDLRLDVGENARGSTSVGLGMRHIVGPDLILGANVFADAVKTDNGNYFGGATVGLEAFTSIFDLRLNAHIPIGGGTSTGSALRSDGVSITNNQLVENRSRINSSEALLYGLTGEIGALFASPFGEKQKLRTYVGGYVYDRDGYDTQSGGRVGLEYRINDVLGFSGSRFTLGAELVLDSEDDLDALATARLRIPLFGETVGATAPSTLSPLEQRMTEGVRRDKGIRAGSKTNTSAASSVAVINPATGRVYGGVYYADSVGGGTGSYADPTSLATAVANAGVDGLVIALGDNGTISTSGVTLQQGQILTGGGETVAVQLSDGTTTNFLLSGTNGTIDGDPGVTTVTLASGATIRDLTIQGGAIAVGGNAVADATLQDLSLQNTTGDGIHITGASNLTLSGLSFSGIGGSAIFLNNHAATLSNITINGAGSGITIANNTGTTTLSTVSISNVTGNALTFTNNTGVINVTDFTANTVGGDGIQVSGGGSYGFSGTTEINGLGAAASSDGIDLSGTTNATLTFGDVDITGLGGGTGLNMAGADATLTMQSLDVTGTGVAGSRGVDISGTLNGRSVTITNGGTVTNVDVGIVLGTNGAAFAAPDAVFTWGGGDIGGLAFALDGIGVNAASGSYSFGTTTFTGGFNFLTAGTPNYFVAATATGTGDGSSVDNRASISTAIGAAGGLGTVNFILINDGAAIDTAGLTFALGDNQTVDTFGDGRTFVDAGLLVAASITGDNIPTGSTVISDPTGNGAATLTNSSGAVSTIEVGNNNAVRNITLGSSAGTALSGTGISGLTIEGVTIGSGGTTAVNGISLTNTTGAVTLTNVSVDNTSGTGVAIINAQGTVTGNNVDITGSKALRVAGGDAAISFNASSSIDNTSGIAVSITGRIGGSFSHFGTISSNGAGASGIVIHSAAAANDVTFGGQVSLGTTTALGGGVGVGIDNNGQSSANAFTGGLEIATTGSDGFLATNGGSISVAAAGTRSISTSGGTAFNVYGTAIGSGGVTFDSVTGSSSGVLPGIRAANLDTTLGGIALGSADLDGHTGAAIEIQGVGGANGFSLTAADIDLGAGGAGVTVSGANGTVSIGTGTANGITGLNIDGGTSGIVIAQTSGTLNLGTTSSGTVQIGSTSAPSSSALSIGSDAGGTINLGNTTNQARLDAVFNGIRSHDADATTTLTNVRTSSQTSTAVTIADNDGDGETRFEGGLAVSTTGGTALSISSARASVASAPGLNTLTASGTGTGLLLFNSTIGSAGLHFDTVNIATSGNGISLSGATTGGDIVLGDVDINGTANGTNAISVSGTVSNTITIADFDTNLLQGQTALDIDGAYSGTMTFGDFDVTSSSTTGTIGIDLQTATGGGTVQVGDTTVAGENASISGVDTGVLLGAATDLTFTFGDGESGIDTGSTIDATTGIDASSAPVAGTYNFQDVAFAGSPGKGFGIGRIYFVDADGAAGGGDGSGSDAANPMTLAAAELAAAAGDIIILINNGSAITAVGTNGDNTLNLKDTQQLLSFGDGAGGSQAIVVNLTVPPTIQLFAPNLTLNDPTGNGAATLTTSAGDNVVTLGASGNRLAGFDLEGNGTAARGIKDNGAGATGTLIERSRISNFANYGIEITPSTNTTISGVTFSGNANDILLNAAGTSISNMTSTGVTGTSITLNNATGTTTLQNISISGAAAGIAFNNAGGTINAVNVDISGGNTLSIDGGDAVFTFDSDSSIDNTAGTAVTLDNRSGGSFTHAGTIASNGAGSSGIAISGATAASDVTFSGTVSLGTTTALGGGMGVTINNNGQASTIAFDAGLDIATQGYTGLLAFDGGTLRISDAASERVTATNARALELNGINSNVTFDEVNATNANMDSVLLQNVDGSFTLKGGTLNTVASGSSFSSLKVLQNDAGATRSLTLDINGLTINHDASGAAVAQNEFGILVETQGDDRAIVSIANSTFKTEDSSVRLRGLGPAGNLIVTDFSDNTLVGDATAFDPTLFGNGVTFSGVTFDSDLATAGLQTVAGGRFQAGSAAQAIRSGIFFNTLTGPNQGTIAFDDYDANVYSTTLQVEGNQPGLAVNIADGSVVGGSMSLGFGGGGPVGGTITLSDLTLTQSYGGHALLIRNFTGAFTVTGAATILAPEVSSQVGGNYLRSETSAVKVVNSAANISFNTLDIQSTPMLAPGAGLEFTTGGATIGLDLNGNTGSFSVSGTTTIADTVDDAIRITDTSGVISFGQVTITNPGTDSTIGAPLIPALPAGAAAIRIAGTIDGAIHFDNIDIALDNDNRTGFDVSGATLNAAVTADDFDLISSSATGTIGVDLRGVLGGQTIRLGDTAAGGTSSSIAGVDTGVFLNAASNANFTFGDGEDGIDTGSTIDATTAIDASSAPIAGTYNFQDVAFAGSPGKGFGVGRIYFVDADGAAGGGDGSGSDAANPMTLADAELAAATDDIIILINNGSAITAAGTNGDNTLNLKDTQQLLSFGDGAGGSQAVAVNLTVPPTIQLFAPSLTIDDPTGNGAATLTTSAGDNVVTLGSSGNHIAGLDLEGNGTAARGIKDNGTGATGTLIERSRISNFANYGIEITPSTNTTISGVTFSGNANDILLNAAGSSISNMTSTGVTGTSITLNNATGTTTLQNISISGAAAGIAFNNAGGTINAVNVDISGGNTLSIDGGDAVFTFDGASSINNTSGTAVSITGRSGGSFTHAGTIVSNGAGSSGILSSGATGAHTISFTGTLDLGTTTALGGHGVFIDNATQAVTVSFADIDVATDGGFGMIVQNGGTLSVGTGSLAVNNAQIANFAGIAVGAGGVNFTSITGTNIAGPAGLGLHTITGGAFTVSGTTSISGTLGSAIAATNVSSDMTFGAVNLMPTSGDGLLLTGNSGTLTTGDMTIAMGAGGNGIRATGTNGNMTFGNVDITNLGAGTGLNLSGGTFDGQVTFARLDISGTSQVGSKGIDLTGYDNSKDVVTTNSGTIQGVQVGVDLTNANIANGVRFQYGDGSAPVASLIDTSGIAGNFAIVTTGTTATGEYNFEDVGFGASNVANLQGPTVFVIDNAGTSGLGTFADPGTAGEAEASGADVIVLIDTNVNGSSDLIDLNAQGETSLDLADGQVLIGLAAGESIDVSTLGISGGGAPASVKLTGMGSSSVVAAPATGIDTVLPTLTSATGNTVTLAGSSGIQNVQITNGGTFDGIAASYAAAENLIVRFSSIGGGTGGDAIDVATTSGASTFDFQGLALTSGLRLDGSGGGSLSGTATGTNTINTTTGQLISLNGVSIAASGMSFDTLASSGKITGNAVTMTNVGGAGTFTANAMNIAGSTANGIDISSSSGAFSFGTVTIGSDATADNVATGIRLDNNSGSFTLTGSSIIHNRTGSGVAITNSAASFAADFQAQIEVRNWANASAGAGDGFVLTNNSTATINFTNLVYNDNPRTGGPLTTGQAIVANDGGILTISGGAIRTNNILGADTYAVDIANTTLGAGGITIETLWIDHDDAGESGGGLKLVNNTGTFTFSTIQGISAVNASAILASNTGTLNIGTTSAGGLTSNGRAVLDISNTTLNLNATHTRSTGSTGTGMRLLGVGGTVNLTGNMTITGSTGTGLLVANSVSGTTFNFSGGTKTINSGMQTAVSLTANTGSTISFIGGGLDIDATAGAGFVAADGGTVTVQGAGNSLTTTTGTALRVTDTTIDAAGLTFQSISSNGTSYGIFLDTTGGAGGLTVTGDGTAPARGGNGSGGTIQNSTRTGIWLNNTVDVNLSHMTVTGSADQGIDALRVNNLTLNGMTLSSNGNANAEHGLSIIDGSGTYDLSQVLAEGNFDSNIRVLQQTGATGMTSFLLDDSTLRNVTTGSLRDGISIDLQTGASVGTITVQNSSFSNNADYNIHLTLDGTATVTSTTISGNTMTSVGGGFSGGGIAVHHANSNSSNAITITGNAIGTAGVIGSAGYDSISLTILGHATSASAGTMTALIQNNTIHDFGGAGIVLTAKDGTSNQAILNATVRNNTVTETGSAFAFAAVFADSRDGNQLCLDLGGAGFENNLTTTTPTAQEIAVRAMSNGTLNLNGYGGAANDGAAIEAYLQGRNTGTPVVATSLASGGVIQGGGACPLP